MGKVPAIHSSLYADGLGFLHANRRQQPPGSFLLIGSAQLEYRTVFPIHHWTNPGFLPLPVQRDHTEGNLPYLGFRHALFCLPLAVAVQLEVHIVRASQAEGILQNRQLRNGRCEPAAHLFVDPVAPGGSVVAGKFRKAAFPFRQEYLAACFLNPLLCFHAAGIHRTQQAVGLGVMEMSKLRLAVIGAAAVRADNMSVCLQHHTSLVFIEMGVAGRAAAKVHPGQKILALPDNAHLPGHREKAIQLRLRQHDSIGQGRGNQGEGILIHTSLGNQPFIEVFPGCLPGELVEGTGQGAGYVNAGMGIVDGVENGSVPLHGEHGKLIPACASEHVPVLGEGLLMKPSQGVKCGHAFVEGEHPVPRAFQGAAVRLDIIPDHLNKILL